MARRSVESGSAELLQCSDKFRRRGVVGKRVEPYARRVTPVENDAAQVAVLTEEGGGAVVATPCEVVFGLTFGKLAQAHRRAAHVGVGNLALYLQPQQVDTA